MITRLQFAVSLPDGAQADASWGYWLYSALLEQMPAEAAEWFHEQSFTPLSQYWLVDKPAHRACWRVSLLGDEAESLLLAPLEALSRLNLRECAQPLAVSLEGRERYASLSEFWNRAAAMPDVPSHQLRIWTPASFKSGGRYVIFPEARLILQNLVLRWNAIAPQCAISDEDALRMLEEEGLLDQLKEKVCIGQGFRGKSGELGVGNCTRAFRHTLAGCPPTENQMYEFLKAYLKKM